MQQKSDCPLDRDRWILARDVYRALSKSGMSPVEIEGSLAAHLRNGDLNAYASQIWKSDERFTTRAWKTCPSDAIGGPIPRRYWRMEKAVVEDRSQWRYIADRFLITTRLKPRRRIMMKGVSFDCTDLHKVFPGAFGSPVHKPKRGRPADIGKRDAVWLTTLVFIFNHLEGKANLRSSTYAAEEVMSMLQSDPSEFGVASDRQVKEVTKLAFDRLKRLDRVSDK